MPSVARAACSPPRRNGRTIGPPRRDRWLAIFITYDDCGCFYDHVPPGTNPDGTRQGIRMPTVIVSPYAKAGYTDSTPATFASMLAYVEHNFNLLG